MFPFQLTGADAVDVAAIQNVHTLSSGAVSFQTQQSAVKNVTFINSAVEYLKMRSVIMGTMPILNVLN